MTPTKQTQKGPPRWRYKDWSPDLSDEIERWVVWLRKFGFTTDHEEVFYQLGISIQVVAQKAAREHIDNMLGVTIEAYLRDMPYLVRRKELRRLTELYAKAIEERKGTRKKRPDR